MNYPAQSPEPEIRMVILMTPDPALSDSLAAELATNCQILLAPNGKLPSVATEARASAVVLLDDQLPEGSPETLFPLLQLRWPYLRAVVLATPQSGIQARYAPIVGAVMLKPVDAARVVGVIRHQLRMSAMSSGVRRLQSMSVVQRLPKK